MREIMRVAIYIRVSTLDQAENGYSLDMQERTLRKWCQDRRYEIAGIYADRGISGKSISHRPAMCQLLKDAENKSFDIVLFWALSRFSRSVENLYYTMNLFQKWNISMVSYTENFDTTTAMGRAMIGIVGIFAQLEREMTSERVAANMQQMAVEGKRTCHSVLGYDRKGKYSFSINEKEAEYVRFCFEEYLKRKSLSEVAELARKRGYRGKRGKIPSAYSIEKIITRPIYCGYNSFRGNIYKGDYDSIISVETFNRVQAILKRQGKMLGRPRIKDIKTLPRA